LIEISDHLPGIDKICHVIEGRQQEKSKTTRLNDDGHQHLFVVSKLHLLSKSQGLGVDGVHPLIADFLTVVNLTDHIVVASHRLQDLETGEECLLCGVNMVYQKNVKVRDESIVLRTGDAVVLRTARDREILLKQGRLPAIEGHSLGVVNHRHFMVVSVIVATKEKTARRGTMVVRHPVRLDTATEI